MTLARDLVTSGEPVPATPPFGPPFSPESAPPRSSVEPQSRSCASSGLIASICLVSSVLGLESWKMDFFGHFLRRAKSRLVRALVHLPSKSGGCLSGSTRQSTRSSLEVHGSAGKSAEGFVTLRVARGLRGVACRRVGSGHCRCNESRNLSSFDV